MNVVDLHPEDLFDKDARGELTSEERVRLDAHLARCSACRAEQILRADFADELDGDEDRPSALLGLVQGALASKPPPAMPEPAAPPTGSNDVAAELQAVRGLRRRPRRTAAFLLVAAAVLAASAAGATGLTGRVWSKLRGDVLEVTHGTSDVAEPSGPSSGRVPRDVGDRPNAGIPVVASSAVEVAPEPSVVEAPPSPPTLAAAPARIQLSAPPVAVAPVAIAPPAVTPPAVTPPAVTPPAVTPPASSAAALFESANAARRAGDTATALARYDALDAQFPGTRESRLAKATAGRLLLDRGDPAGALRRFDVYLSSGSTELREEAMAGRATSLERLGRGEEESRAWAALIAAYPGTPYAAHANVRLRVSRGSLLQ